MQGKNDGHAYNHKFDGELPYSRERLRNLQVIETVTRKRARTGEMKKWVV